MPTLKRPDEAGPSAVLRAFTRADIGWMVARIGETWELELAAAAAQANS